MFANPMSQPRVSVYSFPIWKLLTNKVQIGTEQAAQISNKKVGGSSIKL